MLDSGRLSGKEIDDRFSGIPEDALSRIHSDVSWNYDRIMLPGFEKGLNWKDQSGLFTPKSVLDNSLLPETKQWEELENYAKEKGLTLDGLYKILGMYPTGDHLGHSLYTRDLCRLYLSRANKKFLWIGRGGLDCTVVDVENDQQNPDSRRAPISMKIDGKHPDYYVRLRAE